jgi:hypothetical protein
LANFDPESQKSAEIQILIGEEVKNIEIWEAETPKVKEKIDNLFSQKNEFVQESHLNVEEIRDNLVEWLKKNYLPVKVENSKINILDTVYITSPFRVENCQSTNEIILDKVRNLISKFYSII